MEYEIVKWYDERRTVTHVQGFESAVSEYNKAGVTDKECYGRRAQSPQLHILAWQLINKFS